MELGSLIAALADPRAYPASVRRVETRQTHISVVFLADELVYKIKKPVSLGFLDFSTLERRHHFCQEEVRLNRRLAEDVYLDVVPVARTAEGLRLEARGEVVEWAVKMRRLPDESTLERRLEVGAVTSADMAALAGRIAAFHAGAQREARIAEFGRFEVVARNARENLEPVGHHIGTIIHPAVHARLGALLEAELAARRELIEARADSGVPCDTHGDLRLEHVYWFAERRPPDDIVVIDCIEFNERYRFADPVADIAFLYAGLLFGGHEQLAQTLIDEYFAAAGDEQGKELLPLYTSYRAAVRGKVECIKSGEAEVPPSERAAAAAMARAWWLLALGALEAPSRRPCLLAVAGLPGCGKSTLAAQVAAAAGFEVIRSDVVRKELAGLESTERAGQTFGHGYYAHDWNQRTYAECLRRAGAAVAAGGRAILDASFREDEPRRQFLTAARQLGVPALLFGCQAAPEVVHGRLAARRHDASDADWSIYQQAAAHWQQPSVEVARRWLPIFTDRPAEPALEQALAALRRARLFGP